MAEPSALPGLPEGADLIELDDFGGINTKSPRTAIQDNQFSWLENLFPVGTGNLRAIFGKGANIYTASGATIVYKCFYNIGSVAYCALFLSNGTAYQVRLSNNAVTTISASAGTFYSGSQLPHAVQYSNKYLIIVSNVSSSAYWIWDGSVLFPSGGAGPEVTITAGGTGYSASFAVTFTGGGGSGAAATATAVAGVVTSVTITNPGTGYTSAPTPVFTAGGGSGATGTVTFMPSGVSGTAVETYKTRVWIVNGTNLIFSAPSSTTLFAASSGGGITPAQDSFLRQRYTGLKQTGDFLYVFGDSSVISISNPQTSGSPPTTTFNTTTVDSQVGTPYRDSIIGIGRGIIFVNSSGVYSVYGGEAVKLSDDLDGLFASANLPTTGSGVVPVSGVATIFGIRTFMFLIQANDPFTNTLRNVLCMWDPLSKKWFIGSQESNITFIAPQILDSVMSVYATDGVNLFKCFSQASSSLVKKGKTKLWSGKSHLIDKQGLAVYGEGITNTSSPYSVSYTIDTEASSSQPFNLGGSGVLTFINNSGGVLNFTNNTSGVLVFTSQGISITGSDQGGFYGKYLGFSFTSQSENYTITSMSILYKDYRFYR